MANRFLETNYYKSPFVRGLKGAIKGLYSFIICDCNASGIWSKDMEAASMYIGFAVTDEDFIENFVLTGKAVQLNNGKYFFPDFIEHQYPKGLQENNAAHKNVIFELNKYDLLDEKNNVKVKKKTSPFEAPLKPLYRTQGYGYGNSNGKELGNSNGNGNTREDKFNTRPSGKECDLILPEVYIKQAIEYLDINKQIKKSEGQISVMWETFKLENFTGANYYESEIKVYTHFLRSIKNEKNGQQINSTSNKSNSKIDALKRW